MISYNNKFVFIHIPKTAGQSIKQVLQAGAPDAIHLPHMSVQQHLEWLGTTQYEQLFTFSFVRNPWARWVSMYHYFKKKKRGKHFNEVDPALPFNEWLPKQVPLKPNTYLDWLKKENGELGVQFIGKVEEIEKDVRHVCALLGFKIIPTEIPKINTSTHNPYQTYYSEESKRLVEEHHAADIEFFKYEFA